MIFAPVIAMILLSGCAKNNSDLLVYCQTEVTYTKQQTEQLADELMSLPSDSTIVEALSDYSALRASIRKCRKIEERL
jgi:hypothetical protein